MGCSYFHFMPTPPYLCIHSLLNLLLHLLLHLLTCHACTTLSLHTHCTLYCISLHAMISIIFFNHDPFHVILPDFTSSHSSTTLISFSHHLPPLISLLSIFNPFTSLNIPFGQFFNPVSASSAFSVVAFCFLFPLLCSFCCYTCSCSSCSSVVLLFAVIPALVLLLLLFFYCMLICLLLFFCCSSLCCYTCSCSSHSSSLCCYTCSCSSLSFVLLLLYAVIPALFLLVLLLYAVIPAPVLISTILTHRFVHIFLVIAFFCTFLSYHHVSTLLLLPLFPHTSSHVIITPSLNWPHKFLTPTLNNSITFS